MANININRSVNDPFYRYKMPKIIAKIEGKGNGIKTVIANMSEIAKALARPPTYENHHLFLYPTKYFGCELGAQTKFDLVNDRYIVNGAHEANKLQEILDGFIKKFILCPSCENPETMLTVKAKTIHGKCKACGHAFTIDPKHKLSTFILKNPPPSEANDAETKKEESSTTVQDHIFDDFSQNITANDVDEFDDWVSEPSDGGLKQLPEGISNLVMDNDLDKSEDERLDMLYEFFEKSKAEGSIQDSKKMLRESERLEVKEKAPLLLCQVIFDTDVLKQITQYRTLLLRLCLHDQTAQKFLLIGIEKLIKSHLELLPKAAHILKKLYDESICTEEAILAWGAKRSKLVDKELAKQIRAKCQPVLSWLEEAEEESETDEEDEDVEFNDRARQLGTVIEKLSKDETENFQITTIVDNGEEIDIDNI